jgi:capsular exopolysaccharide synthesis family protein
MPDNELVDPPEADIKPVKPRKSLIYLFAIALGICFPFLWVLFIDSDNKNIRYEKDIKSITNVPIVAHIPHSAERINVLDSAESNNEISEAFRSLRSKLLFINKGIKSPVMLITSSMPKEGKTFTAINLSRFFSLMGKKTILVDFNLRKPIIHSYFNVINNVGVSSWLTGINNLEEVIIESKVRNLYIIPGGPVQPNPSELLALEKSDELIKLLKEKFDFIIIDSAPVGAVSDAFHLATISDSGILVVRQNLTHKAILQDTLNELSSSGINQPGIVVNDIVPSYKRFKYT